jgi:hypothetical protein
VSHSTEHETVGWARETRWKLFTGQLKACCSAGCKLPSPVLTPYQVALPQKLDPARHDGPITIALPSQS